MSGEDIRSVRKECLWNEAGGKCEELEEAVGLG